MRSETKKIEICQRCDDVYVETNTERVSRKLRDAAKMCQCCLAALEVVKKKKGLSKIYYVARLEPMMF